MKNLVNRLTNGEKPRIGDTGGQERGICGKVIYTSKEDVEDYIYKSGKDLNSYYCTICFAYHMTSKKD